MVKKVILALVLAVISFPCRAAVNLEEVAKNAISSMVKTVKDPDLKHLGILSIQDETGKVDTEELGEILTYELVNDGRFQVVERGLLDELIGEIEHERESGYFDQKKANQYGGIKGIDGLLVGRVYQAEAGSPILILKLLDLERQSLAWATEINLSEEEMPFKMLANAISSSIREAENRLKERGINRIALWNISNNTELKLNKPFLIDKLTADLVAKTGLTVIDRGNIEELYKEKGLAEKYYLWVDQETAARLGKGYGINAFIYGAIYENPILHEKNPSLILKMVDIEKGILVWAKEVPLTEDYLETGVDRAVLDLVNNLKKTESGLDVKRVSLLQFVDETTEKRIDDRAVVDKMIARMVEELSLEMVDRESLEAFKEEIQLTKEGVLNKQTMAKKGESRGIDAFIYGKLTQASEKLERNQVAYKAELLVSLIDVESVATVAMEKGEGERIITSKKEVKGFRKIEKREEELVRSISQKESHLASLERKYDPNWRKPSPMQKRFLFAGIFTLGMSFILFPTEPEDESEEAKKAAEEDTALREKLCRIIGGSFLALGGIPYVIKYTKGSSIENGIKQDKQELNRLKEELNRLSLNYNPKEKQIVLNYQLRF
ncbi:penicillin-binding protein activator LpoB [bacterium]|nr:penicillin-binding protein activator LpoB [bacterium]MBU1615218.1 penicillin-binding protein activator LpoB [bacterium]